MKMEVSMKIILGADVVPTAFSEPLFKKQETEKLFSDVLPIMQNADRTIINLECALTETNNPIIKFGPNIKVHTDVWQELFPTWNHTNDLDNPRRIK